MVLDLQGFPPETGTVLTSEAEHLLLESASRLPIHGDVDRNYVAGLPDRVRKGELGIITMLRRGEPIGITCHRCVDNEAEVVYCCLKPSYEGLERLLISLLAAELARDNVAVIRSSFSGPGADRFSLAALELGFKKVVRMSMTRGVTDEQIFSYKPSPGLAVLPWSTAYFEEVCRLMYEASEDFDRAVYPLFGSPEGARTLLLSILRDRHGLFLPELSLVAESDGKLAGVLLSSLIKDGSVLILDIAVESGYRHSGIGTKLLESLISRCAVLGRRQIVLAVTIENERAIGLYRKMGFRQASIFDQYVLSLEKPAPGRPAR